LTKEQIKIIVEIQINNLNKVLIDHKIRIQLTEKAKDFLADKGFDPDYGARPLKRAIQTHIQDTLSLKLLEGDFNENDIVEVDINRQNSLIFKKIGEMSP
jgi:ATP-dependent Clp protease ATP-binding subunit ClpB